jgi:tripeptidyl-peptidase I
MEKILLYFYVVYSLSMFCDGRIRQPFSISRSECLDVKITEESGTLMGHVYKDSIPLLNSRNDLIKLGRAPLEQMHEVIFAIQPKNMDELTRILHDVSDPESASYGYHLSKDEVNELTSNPEAHATVTSYLHASGVSVVSETLNGEYITASAPISIWERFFNTVFYTFHQTHLDGDTHTVVRAEEYSIPRELDVHVEGVMNTIEIPILSHRKRKLIPSTIKKRSLSRKLSGLLIKGVITPERLRTIYNMGDSHGSDLSTQAVYSYGSNQFYNPSNLAYFQANISMQPLQPAISVGNHNTTDVTLDCVEGNLDLQYIMAMSPGSRTIFWHYKLSLGSWLRDVSSYRTLPLVLSISYGGAEAATSLAEHTLFTTLAKRLGAMGVTIVVASGDSGASSQNGDCRYTPDFPSVNPYVVSVGATEVSAIPHI